MLQLWVLFLVLLEYVKYSRSTVVEPWNLPVLPSSSTPIQLGNISLTGDKKIPRHLWLAVRDLSDEMNWQLPPLFERNRGWDVNLVTNEMKDIFMETVFANTSTLWAYNTINPAIGAAKADVWRYAALWVYGGVYIDDDSDMKVPLDDCINPEDELILSYEKNGFNGNRCYIPRYHLSDFSTFRNQSKREKNAFHGRILLNWAMMSAPRHPIIAETLKNAVEVLKHEYMQDSVLRSLHAAYRWEVVMCATGPSILTGSARSFVLSDTLMLNTTLRIAASDFKDFGGRFKAVASAPKKNPKHYMNLLERDKSSGIMKQYMPEPELTKEKLAEWQNQPIQGQNGKEIFIMDQGQKRGIPNFDTFMAMNISMADVIVITDAKINALPVGPSMPPLDYSGPYPSRH